MYLSLSLCPVSSFFFIFFSSFGLSESRKKRVPWKASWPQFLRTLRFKEESSQKQTNSEIQRYRSSMPLFFWLKFCSFCFCEITKEKRCLKIPQTPNCPIIKIQRTKKWKKEQRYLCKRVDWHWAEINKKKRSLGKHVLFLFQLSSALFFVSCFWVKKPTDGYFFTSFLS